MKTSLCSFFFFIFLTVFSAASFAGGSADKAAGSRSRELVVYAYDSFVADWGPGPALTKLFEAKTGYKVTMVSCGDAAQVLSRAALEKNNPLADVLVGIDNNLLDAARTAGILSAYKPAAADRVVAKNLVLADDWLLTPYDWGYFAIVFDTASPVRRPASLADLTKPEYAKKIILMDPRTSTPGTGFLAWTLAVYGSNYADYWTKLKPNILTLAPGWDAGYALFAAGEAPLVISYTTSPAYHVEYDKTDRYQALIFPEGHITQIEGMGLVRNAPNPVAAKAFIDFMLTDEAQAVLPLTQWMYPVSDSIPLPDSYRAAPRAAKNLSVPSAEVTAAIDTVISILNK